MNLKASLLAAFRTLGVDARLVRMGAWPGWYTWTHYLGRWQVRTGGAPHVVQTRLRVNGAHVVTFLTPQHLGTLQGVFLDDEYDLRAVLHDFNPSTILDLGANVGMAAAYLHARYPNAKYACVEPDPRNQPLLERTIAANNIDATVFPVAVAANAGSLNLRIGSNPTCSALETSPMHELESAVPVEVVAVPQLLAQLGWAHVDLVKIDIEGTEQELLGRNNEWLQRAGALVLEIHPNTSPQEIQSYLGPYGFRLRRLGRGLEPVYLATRF